jgi:hypothetical protein
MDSIAIFVTGTLGLMALVLGGSYAYAKYNDPTTNVIQVPNYERQGFSGGSKTKSKKRVFNTTTRKHKKN